METETRFTTEGLVIKEMKIGESDRLVTLFTREHGLIRAFAAGAEKTKSKKAAATSLLTYSSFTILRKKDTFRIYEATPIRIFFGAGSDIEVLALSQYFCELSNVFASSDIGDNELLRLILNSLHFLTKEKRFPPLIKAITEFRTVVINGYMPNLIACNGCGKFEDDFMFFNVNDGQLHCKDCVVEGKGVFKIDKTLLSALRHIVYSEFKNLYSFSIPEDSAKYLSVITGEYIKTQTEHKFSTLDFYEAINI